MTMFMMKRILIVFQRYGLFLRYGPPRLPCCPQTPLQAERWHPAQGQEGIVWFSAIGNIQNKHTNSIPCL
jgi:hypothetical protein